MKIDTILFNNSFQESIENINGNSDVLEVTNGYDHHISKMVCDHFLFSGDLIQIDSSKPNLPILLIVQFTNRGEGKNFETLVKLYF